MPVGTNCQPSGTLNEGMGLTIANGNVSGILDVDKVSGVYDAFTLLDKPDRRDCRRHDGTCKLRD